MRTRHSTGGVRKQRGRWRASWYENGIQKTKVIGLVKDMTKGEAREAVAAIVSSFGKTASKTSFGTFVETVYFPFYSRKWKTSTKDENVYRINHHLVPSFGGRELVSLKRDELQDFLDQKGGGLSFSVVDHLRWDLKAIFDMGIAEGNLGRNPALLLFTPREAKKPVHRAMSIAEVRLCFSCLGRRERLIAKLAILAGMRPGEIFGLRWGRLTTTYADIQQRVYRGIIDTPKTDQSLRRAALSQGMLTETEEWKAVAIDPNSWVFPSEAGTPMSKDNCWRRNMQPKLEAVGLGWVNFQVFRRTHATLMNALGADGKLVADQLGHSLDVSQNCYTQATVETRLPLVNLLEQRLLIQ